ncbi:MAG: HAD-IA family hydrolase [Gammaproteobacteria bacterium]
MKDRPEIEAVFWDFGGVITSSPFERFNQLEIQLELPKDFIRTVNAHNPDSNAWARLERNEIEVEEFDRQFREESRGMGHEVPGDRVIAALSGTLRPMMVEALKRIKGRLVLGCLTNNMLTTSDGEWVDNTPEDVRMVMEIFDFVQSSSLEGVRKPEPLFYEKALARSGIKSPSKVVFLDDLGINLKPARAMGMHTIKVSDPVVALRELQSLIDLPLIQSDSDSSRG